MTERIEKSGLQVARSLYDMIEKEALPGTGVQPDAFWRGLSTLVHELGPKNRALLAKRDDLQAVQQLVREADFDVLLLDMSMPGKSGIELIKQVRGGGAQILTKSYQWPNDYPLVEEFSTTGLTAQMDECRRWVRSTEPAAGSE